MIIFGDLPNDYIWESPNEGFIKSSWRLHGVSMTFSASASSIYTRGQGPTVMFRNRCSTRNRSILE